MVEGQARTPTVFVTDASAEAQRIADTLRSAGYSVADVPLSMLVSRVSVQRPNVVLLDVDAPGALDEVAKVRRVPGTGAVDFVYFGGGAGPVKDGDDALANEGSAFFERPVDVGALVRRVEALTGGPASAARPEIRRSTPPPSIPPPRKSSIPPSLPSDRPSSTSLPSPGLRQPGPPLPMSTPSLVDLVDAPRSLASFGTVSSELAQLLADAEMRADVSSTPETPLPSPEEEIEAVLPADVLASLDEPLDDDEDEDPGIDAGPGRAVTGADVTGAHGKVTTAGGFRQPTTGSGARSTNPPRTLERQARSAASQRPTVTPAPLPELVDVTAVPPPPPPPPPPASARLEPDPSPGIVLVAPGDARRFLAERIAQRASGAARFEHEGIVRRIVLRDGDFVTAASSDERESLVHFLGTRGELPRDEVERLAGKLPAFGRHAGAALVAHGFLRQDQLWSVLRAHAEWIATSIARLPSGTAQHEPEPPTRLRSEPSVFGAATGCEIFVELVRRAVSPAEALEQLGGDTSRIGDGATSALITECALPGQELELLARARGGTIRDLLARSADAEIVSVLHALALLGVVDVVRSPDFARGRSAPADDDVALLDEDAIRARVRARLELVDDGDYFAVLGVSRDATGYEIRRAFLELRRTFEPSRILVPRLADLADDVRKIVLVLEEAYEILRDNARRERYRRAIEARPE